MLEILKLFSSFFPIFFLIGMKKLTFLVKWLCQDLIDIIEEYCSNFLIMFPNHIYKDGKFLRTFWKYSSLDMSVYSQGQLNKINDYLFDNVFVKISDLCVVLDTTINWYQVNEQCFKTLNTSCFRNKFTVLGNAECVYVFNGDYPKSVHQWNNILTVWEKKTDMYMAMNVFVWCENCIYGISHNKIEKRSLV